MSDTASYSGQDVYSLLQTAARSFGETDAIYGPGFETLKYDQLFGVVSQLANGIDGMALSRGGARPRIAVVFENGPEMSLVVLAA
ncbi:MAG: hypothetical protein KUG58_05290, partial [Marinosulfonomonas sp.]|nr:hypothetical protein [Marinosulfonomonas sp.]